MALLRQDQPLLHREQHELGRLVHAERAHQLVRCTATVLTLRSSIMAISLFDLPCAISCSTCFSRCVSLRTDRRLVERAAS